MNGHARLLGRKLLRDLRQHRTQTLAIALVVACAVGAATMAANVRRSMGRTLDRYYSATRFADVFASADWAPESVSSAIAELPGVAAVETRIATWAALMPAGMREPAVARVLSLPAGRQPEVNRIVLREGRHLSGERDEIIVSEPFADAHGLRPGDRLAMRLAGEQREVRIAGTALSPEAVFALGPGQVVPDERRFAIVWMDRRALADALFFGDEFNDVAVRLHDTADETTVRERLDVLLAPFDGTASYGRQGQPSHAFVQGQIDQLGGLAVLLPPLFLFVAAFLLHGVVARAVEIERRQIGILKALGLARRNIRAHYLLHAVAIAVIGWALGLALGWGLGIELTSLYARFFRFPATEWAFDPAAAGLAGSVAALVALGSGWMAVRRVERLPPAEALRRPPPAEDSRRYRGWGWGERSRMVCRQLLRQKGRLALTAGSATLAIALLVSTLFSFDALDRIVRVTRAGERQDAMLIAPRPVDEGAIETLRSLPGIRQAEGFWRVPVEITAGTRRQPAPLLGVPAGGLLRQLLTPDLAPTSPPTDGVALSSTLADLLDVDVGDPVELALPGRTDSLRTRVSALTEQYFGVEAIVALTSLQRWLDQGPMISGARVTFDPSAPEASLDRLLADMPQLAGYIDTETTLEAFRSTMARTLTMLVSFFVFFAVLTTVGVTTSNAQVLLAERRRDLAVLRALGFSRREVAGLLLAELMLPAVAAVPIGLVCGRLFGLIVVGGLGSELFRIPLVIAPRTDVLAVGVTLVATLGAALVVAAAAARLDLAQALAERE